MHDFPNEPAWRKGLRSLALKHLTENGPQDSHQLANACQVSPDAMSPRMSELEELGLVRDSGERHSSVSGRGRKLKVWEAINEG
ncbi:MAG TPA: hypothetical protein PKA41_11110 [Verrucomicrobiota bacterium]|nr:hypothetical protein [Verrucomicrobiota bacterium]